MVNNFMTIFNLVFKNYYKYKFFYITFRILSIILMFLILRYKKIVCKILNFKRHKTYFFYFYQFVSVCNIYIFTCVKLIVLTKFSIQKYIRKNIFITYISVLRNDKKFFSKV